METDSSSKISEGNKQTEHGKKHTFKLDTKFVRIEYPGLVKNVDKAIDTLGGIKRIEMVASNLNNLYLNFHPENRYNRPCVADKDMNPGILIKIKTKTNSNQETLIDYDVLGVATMNFKFNRMCDFQYLPIVSKVNNYDAEGEMIYHNICPKKIPSLEWFLSKEISTQPRFYFPQLFSRFDSSNYNLFLNSGERFSMFSNSIKPESLTMYENKSQKQTPLSAKKLSACLSIIQPNVKIPEEPCELIMTIIKKRGITEVYNEVKKVFEERPVWTKAAIQYTVQLSNEYAKVILPAVGFYCTMGPWRTCWIKYGYNPLKDFGSRIYQTLDFRIRTSDGVSLKVLPKRTNYKHKPKQNESSFLEERCFILRPNYVPPARQMFYQYCDLHLPEIQDMLQRLPKIPANLKFDPRNGWLPASFTEQCREIVNNYVQGAVQEEIRKDILTTQEHSEEQMEASAQEKIDDNETGTYCSQMLSNIKKGIYKSMNILTLKQDSKIMHRGNPEMIDTVDLSGEITQDGLSFSDAANEIPDTISEPTDDELSEDSDLEIDLEAAEEINELIESARKDYELQ